MLSTGEKAVIRVSVLVAIVLALWVFGALRTGGAIVH